MIRAILPIEESSLSKVA